MNEPTIRTVDHSEAARAISVQMMAFSADPIMRWLWAEPDMYLQHFPVFVRGFGGRAFEHDTAHVTSDFTGGSLWLPPGVGTDDETLRKLFDKTLAEPERSAILEMLEIFETLHPKEPHWHLCFLGVDPTQQCRGLGAALLRQARAHRRAPPVRLSRVFESRERLAVSAAWLRGDSRGAHRRLAARNPNGEPAALKAWPTTSKELFVLPQQVHLSMNTWKQAFGRPSRWATGIVLMTIAALAVWGLSSRGREPNADIKPDGRSFTIFILGGSTAFGEPYGPRADFGLIAGWLFGGRVSGLPIRVVNRGGPGKRSDDVVHDAKEIARSKYEPGTAVALLYLGHNEFLRFDQA